MKTRITPFATMLLMGASMAFSNTPLLVNTTFDGATPWISGANQFLPKTVWTSWAVLDPLTQVQPGPVINVDGQDIPTFVFSSFDNGESDYIETFVFQEYKASPYAGAFGPTEFKTGDVITFEGYASATRSGNDPSDMKVRAFVKTLGWVNNLSHQVLGDYTTFHDVGANREYFKISITFPDVVAMDNPQVVQIGFEISTEYDGSAMDSGTITFDSIQGYIEGGASWAGYDVDANGWADTGSWMGMVNVTYAPWIYIMKTGGYALIDENAISANGGWAYVPAP